MATRSIHSLPDLLLVICTFLVCACGKDDEGLSAEARPRTHAYAYNDRVSFGLGGQGERFQIEGWSTMEPNFTWTDGPIASLGFRLMQAKEPVLLHVKMGANTSQPALPFQPVDVVIVETFANPPHQETIAHWEVAEEREFTAFIPPEFVSHFETITRLEFHIPRATSPADLGQGGDRRRLGLRIAELTFEQKAADPDKGKRGSRKRGPLEYEYGEKVVFAAGRGAERLQVLGWSGAEAEYTWTVGPSAMLGVRVPASPVPVILALRTAGMDSPVLPFQPVDVVVNGEQIAHWEVAEESTFTALIPAKFTAAPQNVLLIEYRVPGATSPAAMGQGADGRLLGLRVREFSIKQSPGAAPNP